MQMEVDENVSTTSSSGNQSLFVCCVSKKGGLKKSKIPVSNLSDLTLESLRNSVIQELSKWEWAEGDAKPTNIEILHCSRVLKTDADVKKIGNLSVVTIIDKNRLGKNEAEEKHKMEKYIEEYARTHNIHDHLMSCSIAIKTAFMNPKFVPMVENLGDSEMLENILAIVPELKNDPVGIGIIQDPTLIFHLCDPQQLKKLGNSRPWMVEAFNFIAASVHQDRSGPPAPGLPNQLFGAPFLEGDDESMEDDDEDPNVPGPSRGGSAGGARITREQLASALSALSGGAVPSSNAFGGLFQPPVAPPRPQPPPAAPAANPGVAAAGANIQNLMNTLAGTPGQPLNSELVARAVTDALRRLTPEQRADQLTAIRNFATQLQQQAAATTTPAPQQQPNPPTPAAPAPQGGMASLAQQYQAQLAQMRNLGISDERLSILALQVSEGDVNTAADLIFSGWQGEGSDPV